MRGSTGMATAAYHSRRAASRGEGRGAEGALDSEEGGEEDACFARSVLSMHPLSLPESACSW
jgi:hypothetical protein